MKTLPATFASALVTASLVLAAAPVVSSAAVPAEQSSPFAMPKPGKSKAKPSKFALSAPVSVVEGTETFWVTGKVTTKKTKRVVSLTERSGDSWSEVDEKKTTKKGAFKFLLDADDELGDMVFRVSTGKITIKGKELKAARRSFTVKVTAIVVPPPVTTVSVSWPAPRALAGPGKFITGSGKVGGDDPEYRDLVVETQTLDGVWTEVDETSTNASGAFTVQAPAEYHFVDMPVRVRVLADDELPEAISASAALSSSPSFTPAGSAASWAEHRDGRTRWDACKTLTYSVNYTGLDTSAKEATFFAAIAEFSALTGITFIEVEETEEAPANFNAGAEWFPGTPNADLVIYTHGGANGFDFNAPNIVRAVPGADVYGPTRVVTRANAAVNVAGKSPRMAIIKALAGVTGVGVIGNDATQMQYQPASGSGNPSAFMQPNVLNPGAGDMTALRRTSAQTGCVSIL